MVDIARAVAYYDDGLEGYARGSNQLLREYIYDPSSADNLMKINYITMDFADEETIRAVIDINFMYISC
jgi:hypothetical protein